VPSTDSGAPGWAAPLLAAWFVARSRPNRLRRLDEQQFRGIARACDRFILWTTAPALAFAAALLPSRSGFWLLLAGSVRGIAVLLAVGRHIALERHRRGGLGDRGAG
jgi:hypothetical protein